MKRCELLTEKQEEGERPDELKCLPPQSAVSKKQRKQIRRYQFMTNDELVNLCRPKERPKARRVVHELRKYLIQVIEKEGFDIDFYPGHLDEVTTVMPLEYSTYCPARDGDPKWIAQSVIDRYNLKNEETKFEVEFVEKMYVRGGGVCSGFTFYLTFCARDVKNHMAPPSPRTFQASVMMLERSIFHIFVCRLKA